MPAAPSAAQEQGAPRATKRDWVLSPDLGWAPLDSNTQGTAARVIHHTRSYVKEEEGEEL